LLVRTVIDRAEQAGDAEVTVPTRRASGFYTRLGFSESATYFKYALDRRTTAASGATVSEKG